VFELEERDAASSPEPADDNEAFFAARAVACDVDGNALSICIATSVRFFKACGAEPLTSCIDRDRLKLEAL
jgi:hypothetical protein